MTTYKTVTIVGKKRPLLQKAKWCDSFGGKLRGFTFRRQLAADDALVLVEKKDSRLSTSIHMLFVSFDLGVVWINDAGKVIDKIIAKPWALSHAPKAPARYVLELHPDLLEQIQLGDAIQFDPIE